jgi:hypothetical protein
MVAKKARDWKLADWFNAECAKETVGTSATA